MNVVCIVTLTIVVVSGLLVGSTGTQRVFSQLGNIYFDQDCGVSIQYPAGWIAEESQSVLENKSTTLVNFESQDEDILGLDLAIEDFGIAQKSPRVLSDFEREFISLNPNSTILESDIAEINGFPSYKIVYSEDSVREDEFPEDKFHTMEILIIAYDREYRFVFDAADEVSFDKYQSIVENMAKTIKISEPNFEVISC